MNKARVSRKINVGGRSALFSFELMFGGGQTATWRHVRGTSALPPITDMRLMDRQHVRKVPFANFARRDSASDTAPPADQKRQALAATVSISTTHCGLASLLTTTQVEVPASGTNEKNSPLGSTLPIRFKTNRRSRAQTPTGSKRRQMADAGAVVRAGSIRLKAGLADHLAPFVGFGRDELAEIGRRARGRLTAQLDEPRF